VEIWPPPARFALELAGAAAAIAASFGARPRCARVRVRRGPPDRYFWTNFASSPFA